MDGRHGWCSWSFQSCSDAKREHNANLDDWVITDWQLDHTCPIHYTWYIDSWCLVPTSVIQLAVCCSIVCTTIEPSQTPFSNLRSTKIRTFEILKFFVPWLNWIPHFVHTAHLHQFPSNHPNHIPAVLSSQTCKFHTSVGYRCLFERECDWDGHPILQCILQTSYVHIVRWPSLTSLFIPPKRIALLIYQYTCKQKRSLSTSTWPVLNRLTSSLTFVMNNRLRVEWCTCVGNVGGNGGQIKLLIK